MLLYLVVITMPRTSIKELSPEAKEAYENYQKVRKQETLKARRTEAEQVLKELEPEYEHSKEVFFKVNGARRTIKALEA